MHPLILNDGHRHYRLHLPGERPLDPAFTPQTFHDPWVTRTFVRGLRCGLFPVSTDRLTVQTKPLLIRNRDV
jgi:hypothetical protein